MSVAADADISWLVTGRSGESAREPEATHEASAPTVRVPIYAAPLGAGSHGGVPSDEIVAYGNLLTEWLETQARVDPRRAFLAQVLGHSMNRLFFDGDLVVGETVEEYRADGTYAVLYDDEMLVKHVRKTKSGLQLISENPAFPPIDVEGEQLDRFRLIGRIGGRLTGHVLY